VQPDGSFGWSAPSTQAILDNQVLTGATGTNTTVTLTPTNVADESGGEQVNYTISASVKVDGTTIVEDPTTKVLSAKQPVITNTQTGAHTIATITDANGVQTNIQESVTGYMDDTDPANHHKIGDHIDENGNLTEVFETVIGVTNTLTSGTKIATIKKEDGTSVDIFAPVNASATGGTDGQVWTTKPDGTTGWVDPACACDLEDLLPTGGTEGQVLTIDENGNAVWETPAGGGTDETTGYGTAAPTVAGTVIGSEYYVTPLGTQADAANATAAYRWDGTQWVKYPGGSASSTLIHERDVEIATAGQTSHTLAKTPIGASEKVLVTRNGVDISDAWTWVGGVGTYTPSANYGCVIDASDKLIFHYEAAV
jgi:hypothetical protein